VFAEDEDTSELWAEGLAPAGAFDPGQGVTYNFGMTGFAFPPPDGFVSVLEARNGVRPKQTFLLAKWSGVRWQVHDAASKELRDLKVPEDKLQLSQEDMRAAVARLRANHLRQVARGLNGLKPTQEVLDLAIRLADTGDAATEGWALKAILLAAETDTSNLKTILKSDALQSIVRGCSPAKKLLDTVDVFKALCSDVDTFVEAARG
jgi:hypothetical protein